VESLIRLLCVGFLCIVAAGCQSSSVPRAPQAVSVTLTAPTDGATVSVRSIEVVGQVQPSTAKVNIAGRPVHLRGGMFDIPLVLKHRVTHITIKAHASGYKSSKIETTVRYDPAAPAALGGTASQQPQSAFARRANAFCDQANTAVTALPQMTTPGTAVSDTEQAEVITARLIRQLRSLTPGRRAADDYASFIKLLQREYSLTAQSLSALKSGASAEAGQLSKQAASAGAQSNTVATRLGMLACAQTPTPAG
jgi:hypothetical protein